MPLQVFTLGLAVILSLSAAKASSTFSVRAAEARPGCLHAAPAAAFTAAAHRPLTPGQRPRAGTQRPHVTSLTPPIPQLVFALVSVGAIVLTVNVVLLGGTIGFFQSLCLLGYCIFPLVVSALVGLFVTLRLVRWIIVPVAIVWSSWASVPFIGGAVPVNRRALAVYPLLLLYATLGWLQLIA